jgi:hypothetical protein
MARQCTLWHFLVRTSHQCSHYWTPSTNLAKSANLVKLQRIYNCSNQQARTNTWPEKITKRFPVSWIIRDTAWHPLVHTSGRMFFLRVCFHIQSRIIILCIKSSSCNLHLCLLLPGTLFILQSMGHMLQHCQVGNLGGNVCCIQLGVVQLVELVSKMMACLKFVGCSSPD